MLLALGLAAVTAVTAVTATVSTTGCGSGLTGPAAPSPTRSVVFGSRTSGVVVEGWLVLTEKGTSCDDLSAALAGTHDTGDALWLLLQRGEALAWEGLYPGTVSVAVGSAETDGRHAELYVHADGDWAALTGNDVWAEVFEVDHGTVYARIDSGVAEGLVLADDCGSL
jgi:hypothetical protein